MKLAKGPRPWTIWAFAAAFIGAALYSYLSNLSQLGAMQTVYELQFPWSGWNRDWTIVALSAVFSIAFIPVAWICLFASGTARWIVTVFSAIQLLDLPHMISVYIDNRPYVSAAYFLEHSLIIIALICLFLPASRDWLNQRRGVDHETFV